MPRKRALFLVLLLGLGGCATAGQRIFYQPNAHGRVDHETLDLMLWQHGIKPDQDAARTLIVGQDYASYYLVQIRGTVKPRRHDFHDLSISVESGSGVFFFEHDSVSVGPGATVFIPHGTAYSYVNRGPAPTVATEIWSPPYDGKDDVPVEFRKKEPPQ